MLSPASRDGIEAFVRRVEGQRFNEYEIVQRKDLGNKPPTTIAYLESEENVEFQVGVLFHENALPRYADHDWSYIVSVDGRIISNVACGRDEIGYTASTMRYLKNGERWQGNLCFTALPTTDDESRVTLRGKDLEEIGNIQIDMYRGIKGEVYENPGDHRDHYLKSHELGIADEKDKKWSAAIGVGDVRLDHHTSGKHLVRWSAIDEVKPYHRFIFKYRTRAVLELLKIAGRPTSLHSGPKDKRKSEVIYIRDSDDEDAVPVVETKASRATPAPRRPSPMASAPRTVPEFDTRPKKKARRDVKPDISLGPDVKPILHSMSQMSLGYPRTGSAAKAPTYTWKT